MLDSKTILAPAKLNIFLKVLNKRKDGYHSLRSGITFIDLFDKIEIKKSDETKIKYKGFFKPKNNNYNDCSRAVCGLFCMSRLIRPTLRRGP